MPVKVKRSVSLDEDLVTETEHLSQFASLSEAANLGLRLVVAQARLDELVREHESAHGEVPAHLVDEVRAWLSG